MAPSAKSLLRQLERIRLDYAGGSGPRKRELLAALESRPLPDAKAVETLHEALCFLRAYPDDPALLARVERMLEGFDRRRDLRRHRAELADSGIAGTSISYRFYAETVRWLVRHWGDLLTVDWSEFENGDHLDRILHLLALYTETPGLDEFAEPVRAWVERLKGPDETDAAFLVRRLFALRMDEFVRQALVEELDIPMTLAPGPGTPARTRAKTSIGQRPVLFQTGPLDRDRPVLRDAVMRRPTRVLSLGERDGERMIDLARAAMVTRARDLDVFMHGDPRDVRLVDWGDGLQFAAIGFRPERRLLFEAVYGFLTLKNGVPIGYVLNSALYGSAEIAYNVFETYRGAEAGRVYGRVLATVRHLFGAGTFTIYPYQLGHGNKEGLRSGAWWFYQKLGFRAREPEVLASMERELKRMRSDRRYRSSLPTLRKLAAHNVYWSRGRERPDVIGLLPFGSLGLKVIGSIAERFGSDRERAARTCAKEAATRFGLRSRRGWTPGERLAWDRWGPVLVLLPGVERWSVDERRAAVETIRAKGGRRESEFVLRFDRHRKLRRSLHRLALDSV